MTLLYQNNRLEHVHHLSHHLTQFQISMASYPHTHTHSHKYSLSARASPQPAASASPQPAASAGFPALLECLFDHHTPPGLQGVASVYVPFLLLTHMSFPWYCTVARTRLITEGAGFWMLLSVCLILAVSLPPSLSLSLALSLSPCLSHSLSLPLCRSHFLSLSLPHSFSFSLDSLFMSHSLTSEAQPKI